MNQKPFKVIQKFKNTEVGQIGISTITVSELNYGIAISKNRILNDLKNFSHHLKPCHMMRLHQNIMG
jgi:predicted nucleic acid-binding protein